MPFAPNLSIEQAWEVEERISLKTCCWPNDFQSTQRFERREGGVIAQGFDAANLPLTHARIFFPKRNGFHGKTGFEMFEVGIAVFAVPTFPQVKKAAQFQYLGQAVLTLSYRCSPCLVKTRRYGRSTKLFFLATYASSALLRKPFAGASTHEPIALL